jgi:DNA-binding NtrC family response regulator/Flp pilus assembly protein TadD
MIDGSRFNNVLQYIAIHQDSAPEMCLHKLQEIQCKSLTTDERGLYWYNTAHLLYQLQDVQKALDAFMQALPLFEAIRNIRYEAKCHYAMGECYLAIQIFDSASTHFERAIGLVDFLQDSSLLMYRYVKAAYAHILKHDYPSAVSLLMQSVDLASRLQNNALYAQSYNLLGTAVMYEGRYHQAVEYFYKAFEYNKFGKNHYLAGQILNNIALIQMNMEKFDDAFQSFAKARIVAEKHGFVDLQGEIAFNTGRCFEIEEHYEDALKNYFISQKVFEKLSSWVHLFKVYNNLGNCYRRMKRYKDARREYRKCSCICRNLNLNHEMLQTVVNIAESYRIEGCYEEALHELDAWTEHLAEIDGQIAEKAMHLQAKCLAQLELYPQAIEKYETLAGAIDSRLTQTLKDRVNEYENAHAEIKRELEMVRESYELLSEDIQDEVKHNLVGVSAELKHVLQQAMLAAKHPDANVLITGESGTGKEIIARIIHFASARKKHLLVPINTTAITESLAESAFFGHVKGAFTSAHRDRDGFFKRAHKGTLFLDEIGDMPLSFQAKLLRVLETGIVTPVGGHKKEIVDCRIISCTNKDLFDAIQHDTFRLDLLHRLNTIEIHIAPLRERIEDIEPLCRYFIKHLAKQMGRIPPRIEDSFIARIKKHDFPGNVRELKNILERVLIQHPSEVLKDSHLTSIFRVLKTTTDMTVDEELPEIMNLAENERHLIMLALKKTGNNQREAAQLLGISKSAMSRKIQKIQVESREPSL